MKRWPILFLSICMIALFVGSAAARDVANPGLRPIKAYNAGAVAGEHRAPGGVLRDRVRGFGGKGLSLARDHGPWVGHRFRGRYPVVAPQFRRRRRQAGVD